MDWDTVKEAVEERALKIDSDAKQFRTEMLALINDAKNNEILNAFKALNKRLDDIEARLPDPELE